MSEKEAAVTTVPDRPKSLLLINDDLFLSTRIMSVLKGLEVEATLARNLDEAITHIQEKKPEIVMVNLNSLNLGGVEAVWAAKAVGAKRILAFINHTRISEVKANALEVGAERIVANSAVNARLPVILKSMMHREPPVPEDEE
ncbi:MAG: hypothetical protein ABJA67_14670 [Chthonomonadales bacterium]